MDEDVGKGFGFMERRGFLKTLLKGAGAYLLRGGLLGSTVISGLSRPVLAAGGIYLDPTINPSSQGFIQDGVGPAVVSGGSLLVGDGTSANRNLWLRDEPGLDTRKVKVRCTVSAAATALEAGGSTGVGLVLDANTGRAAQVVLADIGGVKKIALVTPAGLTPGVQVTDWGAPVTFELSWDPVGDITLDVVGGGQESVALAALQSSLGLRPGPYWGFGCASGTAVVTATFGSIEEVSSGGGGGNEIPEFPTAAVPAAIAAAGYLALRKRRGKSGKSE